MFGGKLFISLVIFLFVYIIGHLTEVFIVQRDLGRVGNTVKHLFFFVGVIFHEASHRLMDILVGVPSHNLSVKYRDENSGHTNPHGSVTLRQPHQMTFLQAFLGSFAPVLFSAWVMYYLLLVAFNPFFDPIIRVIAGLVTVSVLMTLKPSHADLRWLTISFQNDSQHSLYQIFLVILSFLITWAIVGVYEIMFPVEYLYYFLIILFYVLLKYGFILARLLVNKLRSEIPHSRRSYRRMARRRYKPKHYSRY
jgi:hypothetical protein